MGILDDTKDQVKAWQGLIGLVVGAIIASCFMLTQCSPPAPAPAATPVLAKVNPEVKREVKVDTPLRTPSKSVKAYPASVKNKLVLPKEVLDDEAAQVLDSTELASSEKRQIVSTILDTETGATTSYVTAAPSPWLALEDRGQLSLDYGIKRGSREPVARLNLRQDVLQIKRLHLGASASAYSDGDYFVGIGGSIRW